MVPDMHFLSAMSGGLGVDMTPELSPVLIGILIVFALLALVVINVLAFPTWVKIQPPPAGVYRKWVLCPVKHEEVTVDFLTPLWDPSHLLSVESCSALQRGEAMHCDQSCLRSPQARTAPPLFAVRYSPVPFPLM
jgi:hypothetical protein